MARTNYVKGKSTEDLLNMDYDAFSTLTAPELRQVVSRLADTANKRLKRFGKTVTPATLQAKRGGGRFSTKGKNIAQLRAEYARVRAFLQNPTSTKKGYEKLKEDLKKQGINLGGYSEVFWRLYHNLEEVDPGFKALTPSDRMRIIEAELEAHPEFTEEEHIENLLHRMESQYEDIQQQRRKVDFSDFFEPT